MATTTVQPLAPGEGVPRTRPRGCWSFVFTGTTGCAAFLLGALIAGLALSPKIFAPYLARQMTEALDPRVAGDLEVGSARIAWSEPVLLRGVRLRDEVGVELLAGDLELPGLLELMGPPAEPTIVRARVPSLWIAIDENGDCPLLSGLARPASSVDAPLEPGGRLHPLDALRETGFQALRGALRVEVECDELTWSDARAGGHGARLTDASIVITTTPRDGELRLDLEARAKLAGSEQEWRLVCGVQDYLAPTWTDVEVEIALEDAPATLLDAWLGTEGWLAALFGDELDLAWKIARGDPARGAEASGSLRSARARCEWSGQWREGRLSSDTVRGELSATPPCFAAGLDELLGLAPGRTADHVLALQDDALPWPITEASFVVTTRVGMPLDETAQAPSWTCHTVLTSPVRVQLSYRDAPLVELGDSSWTLDRSARGSKLVATAAITAAHESTEDGRLSVVLERDRAPSVASSVHGKAERAPAAALDALLGRGSWVAAALGPVLDVDFGAADVRARPVELEVELRSPAGSARFRGSCEDRTLVSHAESALVAELALRPAVEARLLRPLLPWLDRFEAPSQAPGLTLALDAFRLPLDGECAKLQGVARLEAPSWSYGFQARLGAIVTHGGAPARFDGLGPYAISITNGVAAYEGHSLTAGGGTVDGEVSLVDGGIELELAVPLEAAPNGADPANDEPRTTLALDLHGTLEEPRLGVGFEELGELVRKGGGLLEEMRGRMSTLLQGEKKAEGDDDDQ